MNTTQHPYSRSSRLTAPVLPKIIERESLLEALGSVFQNGRHGWLFAPPGAGKTTLAASLLDRLDYQAVWFQLAATDSDPPAFFHYLSEAAGYLVPGIGKVLPQLTPEYVDNLSAFSLQYFDCLFRRLPERCFFVLDNYQELQADSAVHDAVAQALTFMRSDQRLLAMSRQAPPAQLARTRVNQQISVFDWRDIRFSPTECNAFLVSKGVRDGALIEQITSASDGWVAGLVLMQQIGRPLRLNQYDDPDYQLIFDYFAREALRIIPASQVKLLACAALLDHFSPSMVAKLHGGGEQTVTALVTDLYTRQFFLHRHGRKGNRFQFHPLFRQFLLTEYRRQYQDEQRYMLQRRAAVIAGENGQLENSVSLLIQIRDWLALSRVCIENAPGLLQVGRHRDLLRWIESIPRREREKASPWLLLHFGCAQLPFAPLAAQEKLEWAYRGFKAQDDLMGRFNAWALAVEGLNLSWDSFSSASFWMSELESILAVSDYPSFNVECRISLALLSLLIWAEGGTKRFPRLVRRCEALLLQAREPSLRASLSASLLHYHTVVSGNARAANRLIASMHDEITTGEAVPLVKTLWYTQHLSHYMVTCAHDAGIKELQSVIDLIDSSGIRVLETVAAAQTALLCINCGDFERADLLLKKVNALLTPRRQIEKLLYMCVCACRYIQRNEFDAAIGILEEGFATTLETNIRLVQAIFSVLCCDCHLRLGQAEKATYYRNHLEKVVSSAGSNGFYYQLMLLDVQIARYNNDLESAKTLLAKALQYGGENGILNLWGAAKLFVSVYEFALRYGIEENRVKNLIRTLQLLPEDPAHMPEGWPRFVRVTTLGRFALELGEKPVPVSARQKKVLAVLTLLIVEHRKPLPKERIKYLVWPDAEKHKAEQNFKSTVVRLRKLIGVDAVIWKDTTISLNKARVWVDYWEVEDTLSSMHKAPGEPDSRILQRISSLYQGRLFATEESHWLLTYRTELHEKCIRFFAEQSRRLLTAERLDEALQLAGNGQHIDPTVEAFYQVEIAARLKKRDVASAKAAYQRCSENLAKRLKIMPSLATKRLIESV